jgi:uncharacterized membrane protein YhhN
MEYVSLFLFCISTYLNVTQKDAFSKCLIVPSLLIFYLTSANKIIPLLCIGMAFGFLGDVFLIFGDMTYFLVGLASFFMGHIAYCSVISKRIEYNNKLLLPFIITIAVFLALGIIMFLYFRSGLGSMLIPVVFYLGVLLLITCLSVLLLISAPNIKHVLLVIGSFLFFFSDTLIAYGKFIAPIKNGGAVIMLTYAIAQFLIVFSLSDINLLALFKLSLKK